MTSVSCNVGTVMKQGEERDYGKQVSGATQSFYAPPSLVFLLCMRGESPLVFFHSEHFSPESYQSLISTYALYLCSLFVGRLCTLRAFAILVVRLLPHVFETKRKAKHLNLNAEPQCIDCPCLRIQCWETLEEHLALFCSANVNFLFLPSIQYVSFLILIC